MYCADRPARLPEVAGTWSEEPVADGWEDGWRAFHTRAHRRREALGRAALGDAAGRPAGGRDRSRAGVRHGLARDHAALPRAAARAAARARLWISAAARACWRSRPRGSGTRRCSPATTIPIAVEVAAENAARNNCAIQIWQCDALYDELPKGVDLWLANLQLAPLQELAWRPDLPPRLIVSGLLAGEAFAVPGYRDRRAPRAGRVGGTAARARGCRVSFSVEFLGCKISQTDMQGVRERLLAGGPGGGARGRRGARRQHLLRDPRGGRARAARRCARRCAAGPEHVYVTGCATRPRRRRVRGCGRPRHGRARDRRGGGRAHRARARRDGLRRPGAAARAHARVRQGAGRLHVRLRVLRDPARARREPLAAAARRARRGAPARRAGAPRARRHRRQPRPLPRRPRRAPSCPTCCSALAELDGHRARPALVDRGQPPQRAPLRRARAPARLPAPARAAAVGRRRRAAGHAPPLRPRAPMRAASSAPARACPGSTSRAT